MTLGAVVHVYLMSVGRAVVRHTRDVAGLVGVVDRQRILVEAEADVETCIPITYV